MSVQSDLDAYAGLLKKWNAAQNLVSRETIEELWPRHIDDSLQLMRFVRPTDNRVIDLGSGGGFPGIPLAIASRGLDRRFTLVEPTAKKASFLRTVARELNLPVSVEAVRAEQIDSRETYDLVTSRALMALPGLLDLAVPFLASTGHMLLHKGKNYREELAAVAAHSRLSVLVHTSETDSQGVILEITHSAANSTA
jgi:16S rRNA (guanine527-N7)-methyltransferase